MSGKTRRELLAIAAAIPLMHDLRQQSGGSASQLAMALRPDDGELVYVGRDPVRIKVGPQGRQGRFGMITQDVSPGTSIPSIYTNARTRSSSFSQAAAKPRWGTIRSR